MKYFLEMIETARRSGIYGVTNENMGADRRVYKASGKGQEPHDLFWLSVENCRPFVFVDRGLSNGYR